MAEILYQITLQQPVLVTSLEGDPNSAETFDYIPGSVIRGLLIGQAAQRDENLDAADNKVRRPYFDGACFLNAYPLVDGIRALPTPASWQRIKGQKNSPVFDVATQPPPKDGIQRNRVKIPFQVYYPANKVRFQQPQRYLNIHINRGNRKRGRPWRPKVDDNNEQPLPEAEGAVYRYDALAAGQVFAGVILCDEQDKTQLKEDLQGTAFQGTAFLGKARTGGYGRVEIKVDHNFTWQPQIDDADENRSAQLRLTALSDLLLRDERGCDAVGAGPLIHWVNDTLGRQVKLKAAFDGVTEVGAFNRKWGLPLPQRRAIAMGSVFTFEAELTEDELKKLRAAAQMGIGDRTVDGFGQIAVNMNYPDEFPQFDDSAKGNTDKNTSEEPNPLAGGDADLARTMLGRIADAERQALIRQEANTIMFKKIPNPSQLAQLRAIAHAKGATFNDIQKFKEDSVSQRQDARVQFERFRVNGEPFWVWWESVTKDPVLTIDPISIGGVQEKDVTKSEAQRYALRLLDEVLARAINAKKQEEQS